MAIKLIGNYAKRLGLPGYSSHQFSVSVETELTDTGDIPGEAARIYALLQDAVDREIQETGFVPRDDYGLSANGSPHAANGSNGHSNGQRRTNGANGHHGGNGHSDRWSCSDKQKEFILKLVDEHSRDRDEVDHLARQRFGKGVRQLNKVEASGLIDELLDTHGNGSPRSSNGKRRNAYSKNGGRDSP